MCCLQHLARAIPFLYTIMHMKSLCFTIRKWIVKCFGISARIGFHCSTTLISNQTSILIDSLLLTAKPHRSFFTMCSTFSCRFPFFFPLKFIKWIEPTNQIATVFIHHHHDISHPNLEITIRALYFPRYERFSRERNCNLYLAYNLEW